MSDNSQQVNFNFDPAKVPVLYVDAFLIGSNEHVITFNFAQAVPGPGVTQQQVVSRLALTLAQAKEFVQVLNDHIERHEL